MQCFVLLEALIFPFPMFDYPFLEGRLFLIFLPTEDVIAGLGTFVALCCHLPRCTARPSCPRLEVASPNSAVKCELYILVSAHSLHKS